MRRLLRVIWNSITAFKNFIGNLLFLAILIVVLVAVFSQTSKVSIPATAALVIDPSGTVVEQRRAIDPVADFLGDGGAQEAETLLTDITEAISTAAGDERIKIMVLRLDALQDVSMSQMQEIGSSIAAFKTSGKPVYAFADSYSQNQYYLAAHADHVYLNDTSFQVFGGVFMTGMGVYPTFFKSALDKLKVQFHVFKVGTYKGAVEPFLRDDMSPEAEQANLAWLQVLWNDYLTQVASLRELDTGKLTQYIEQYAQLLEAADSNAGQLALEQGLVDGRMSRKQWRELMQQTVGSSDSSSDSSSDYAQVTFRDYLQLTRPPLPVLNPGAEKIAVITAKGTIYDGEQPAGSIGSDSVVTLIKRAREDATVKALVLRIDSPGGSATAAEQIRYELELTQMQGKPVIISMGTYAASGGYWISATANRIFASPTTITGSIGTFLMFPSFEQSLAEIGVYSDGIGTTSLSGALNPLQPINPMLKRILELSINNTYRQFINLVARGRNMTPEAVDNIAQGRVWAGTTALELGLVDAIGNLDDAVTSAANLVGISNYEILHLEKQLSPKERLMGELLRGGVSTLASLGGSHLANSSLGLVVRLSDEFAAVTQMSQTPGIYLQCLACRQQ
jgi:protease-4